MQCTPMIFEIDPVLLLIKIVRRDNPVNASVVSRHTLCNGQECSRRVIVYLYFDIDEDLLRLILEIALVEQRRQNGFREAQLVRVVRQFESHIFRRRAVKLLRCIVPDNNTRRICAEQCNSKHFGDFSALFFVCLPPYIFFGPHECRLFNSINSRLCFQAWTRIAPRVRTTSCGTTSSKTRTSTRRT